MSARRFRHARTRPVPFGSIALALVVLAGGVVPAIGAYQGREPIDPPVDKDSHGVFITDGSFVHNVGELQMNITNWGLIGSRPGSNSDFSDQPSGMWPAGSGVDYLGAAGVWIGALKNNVPLVSTGQYTPEFLANPDDPLDTIYATFQGAVGGARFPDPGEDDDSDGLVNEDPLNGVDDDLDGKVDEDFRAIGNQHFRCVMKDNTALAIERFSDHEPLDLQLVQESFQWENDAVDDFIGFEFEIKNIGIITLKDVYLGFFADCDVGPRGQGGIADDDLPGFFEGAVRAQDNSLVPISIAYMYDADGDGGVAPGFFGIMFLNHPTDLSGVTAPATVGITSFQAFAGNAPFDRGGDPNNDAERYELLSRVEKDTTPPLFEEGKANDFRILLASGPFVELAPGETLTYQAAMVAGDGERGLQKNAAEAALTYYGAYFDRDIDPDTGVEGRETKICEAELGDAIFEQFVEFCDTIGLSADDQFPPPISEDQLDEDGCIYVNADCMFERARGNTQCKKEKILPPEALGGCTGVQGKEFQVTWLVGLAPVPPDMRVWQTDNRVHVYWNNMSQIVPDVRLQEVDFESYLLWRAEGYDRPFGSSISNGPESKLWSLIAEFDVVDFFENRRELADGTVVTENLPLGANTGLDVIAYTPWAYREGTPQYEDAAQAKDLVRRILEDPRFSFLNATIDPAQFVRFRKEEGVTDIGLLYPELRNFEGAYDVIDTVYWVENGVKFFEYVDRDVFNGIAYFYAVTASDFNADAAGEELLPIGPGLVGDAQSNFRFAIPRFKAQTAEERDALGQNIYVFPNPATREALAEFSEFNPNANDPTGVRVMFANLPAAHNTIRIYTLAGDLVETIEHDGTVEDCPDEEGFGNCGGAAFWNLVSRNGQEVVSGIYLYSVESDDSAFDRVVGRFVVVR